MSCNVPKKNPLKTPGMVKAARRGCRKKWLILHGHGTGVNAAANGARPRVMVGPTQSPSLASGCPARGSPTDTSPWGGCALGAVCAWPHPLLQHGQTDGRTGRRTEGPAVQEGRNKASRTGPGQLQSPTEMPPAPDLVASIHCGDADGRTAFLLLLLVLLPQRRAGGALRRGRTPAGPAPCSARRPASGPSSWW